MKKQILISIIYLFFTIHSFSQNYNFEIFANTEKSETIGSVCKKDCILGYNFYRMGYSNLYDTTVFKQADSVFYEIHLLNTLNNKYKKHLVASYGDTMNFCWTHTPYYNEYNKRYYFNMSKIRKDSIYQYINPAKIARNIYIESYDTNLLDKQEIQLQPMPKSTRGYNQCNKIIEKDSYAYAVSNDSNNTFPKLCKFDLQNGNIIDSVDLVDKFANMSSFGHSGFIRMDWVNDSVIILFSDYIHYINIRNMTLLDTVNITYPTISDLPSAGIFSTKFNVKDSSYLYCNFNQNKVLFYKLNGFGINKFMFEVPIIANGIQTISGPANTYNNFDYSYFNHIYTGVIFSPPSDDTIMICHSNINGITDWIKVMKAPNKFANINLSAMKDSSMFAFITVSQPSDNTKYDVYYLKLDQFGNQIFPLGMDKNSLKIINELIIYPNPGNGQFYIGNLNLSEIKSITILNSNGQVLKKLNNSLIIDVSELPTQTYFIEIKTNKGNIIKKIIKQ